MKTNVFTLVLVLLVIIFVGIQFGSLPWTSTRIAGVVIGLPSMVLLVLARIELGGSFSGPPEGSNARHSRPLFSNSQPHLPIRRPGDRGSFSLYQSTALSVDLRRSHSLADLSSTPGRESPRSKIR